MPHHAHEGQLELFDLPERPTGPRRPPRLGCWRLQVRDDQLVLGGIAALIGLTIVFAIGVERGKQLVRAERVLLARQAPVSPTDGVDAHADSAEGNGSTPRSLPGTDASPSMSPALRPTPSPGTPASPTPLPDEKAIASSRYAVQLVTYSRPHLAQQELKRLHAQGEPAFLVMKNSYTVLYVGPFPSKGHAREQLTKWKARYQDCFVKTL